MRPQRLHRPAGESVQPEGPAQRQILYVAEVAPAIAAVGRRHPTGARP
jgi:hypothetical protein